MLTRSARWVAQLYFIPLSMFLIDSNISIFASNGQPKFVKKMDMIIASHHIVMLMILFILTPFGLLLDWIPVSLSSSVGFFVKMGTGYSMTSSPIMDEINLGVISIGYGRKIHPLWYQLIMNLVSSFFRVPIGVMSSALR